MNEEISFALVNSRATEVVLQELEDQLSNSHQKNDENNFSLGLKVGLPVVDEEKTLQHFVVEFYAELQLKEKYLVKIRFKSLFKTNSDINAEFMSSHYPNVNAPAIAFPFFRSFISTFLLNAGYEPIILPAINFVKLYKNNEERV